MTKQTPSKPTTKVGKAFKINRADISHVVGSTVHLQKGSALNRSQVKTSAAARDVKTSIRRSRRVVAQLAM